MKKEHKKENKQRLVLVCKHILKAREKKEEITIEQVEKDLFVCLKCEKKMPKTKKEFMSMFVSLCSGCLNARCK